MRTLLISFAFAFICVSSQAQNIKLEGSWQLQNIDLLNNQDEANEVKHENCFFAAYTNPSNLLDFTTNTVAILIGQETQLFEWRIERQTLILSANNKVLVKGKDNKVSSQQQVGETSFDIQRKGKVLILQRVNNTFTETYTFSLAK